MKKITTLLVLLLFSTTLFAQDVMQLEPLLQRLETLKNSPLDFNTVLNQHFNVEEQQLLLAHFETINNEDQGNNASFVPDAFIGLDIRNNGVFGSLDGTPPYDNFDVINTNGLIAYADDFNANGVLYALQYDTTTQIGSLVTVDPITGNFSTIDDLAGLTAGHSPSGLSYNFDDGEIYALSTNGSGTQLYSLNLLTAVLTPIGTGTGNNTGIWLEIDTDGNAWMADISSDLFYSVNLTTGTASPVGPLDVDISFAQDATYDHVNGELFMAAYQGGGTGGIYSINTSTGLASFIGQTDALNVEFGMFSAPGTPLSVEDHLERKVSVYPNPVNEKLILEALSEIEITNASLYNVLGMDTGVIYKNGSMDVSLLPQGIYILMMKTSEGTLSQKIVKK